MVSKKPGDDDSKGPKKALPIGSDLVQNVGNALEQQNDMPDFYTNLFVKTGEPRMIKIYGHKSLDDERSRLAIVKKLQELVDHPSSVKNTGKILFEVDCIQMGVLKNGDFEIKFTIGFSDHPSLDWLISIVLPQNSLDKRVEPSDALMVTCEMPEYSGNTQRIQKIINMTQLLITLLPSSVRMQTYTEENRNHYDYDIFAAQNGDFSSFPPSTPTVTQEEYNVLQNRFVREDLG